MKQKNCRVEISQPAPSPTWNNRNWEFHKLGVGFVLGVKRGGRDMTIMMGDADIHIVSRRVTRSSSSSAVNKQKKKKSSSSEVNNDVVSRRRMTRRPRSSSAIKHRLELSEEEEQRQLIIREVIKKQKKNESSLSSSSSTRLSLSWQTFIQNLEEEEHEEEDNSNSCSDFYHRMIRLTYELPSDDDDEKRQFRLQQQLLEQQGKIKIKRSRRFTPIERKRYTEKVQSSQGFDVVDVPDHIFEYNLITPYPEFEENSRIFERVKYSAKLALHFYNKQQHREEKYQFVKVLKVNVRSSAGCIFYITFEAKPMMDTDTKTDRDAPPHNFQARVYAGITETKVDFCRPEQKSS